ncbi:MAG TPA: hypothetical protein VK881_16790 [bacterium]|nr:hypothetical protein [bacterium]
MLRVMTVLTLGLSLAVACGPAVSQQSGTAPADLQRVPPQKVPEPLPNAPAGARGAADLGMPMTVQPGKVSIVLSAPVFKEGDVIRAVIANGLERTLYTEDEKTDCSIVFLERSGADTWHPVPGCALGRAPLVVAIGPGRGRAVTINPFSFHLRMGMPTSTKPAVGAGTYRIRFVYRVGLAGGSQEFAAISRSFSVNP